MKKKDTAATETVPLHKAELDTPAEKEPEDLVAKAIAEVQADKDYVHTSAEHLEVRVVRKLLEWGYDVTKAEYDVRMRLY
jgi:hypothetical protein